jgi:parallel beta-helix repeat protein
MISLLFLSLFVLAFTARPAKAQSGGTIYINPDGSIDPPTAPISTVDNITYIFTGNIINESIFVNRDYVTIDGAGYALQGANGSGPCGIDAAGTTGVTIENVLISNWSVGVSDIDYSWWNSYTPPRSSSSLNISDNRIFNCNYGVWLFFSSGSVVDGNVIENNQAGVVIEGSSYLEGYENWPASFGPESCNISDNTIIGNDAGIACENAWYNDFIGNKVVNNLYGISLNTQLSYGTFPAFGNRFYHNNMVGNSYQVNGLAALLGEWYNYWDNGYPSGGNYWSDYYGVDKKSGPYQNLTGSDGIGDTPYVIDAYDSDNYPLMHLWSTNWNMPALSARLVPSHLVVNQGTATATATLNVANFGASQLIWSIASSPSWMSFSQTQGNTISGKSTPVAIQIQTASLILGVQQGSITIQSNGGQETLTLTMTLATTSPPPGSNAGSGWGSSGEKLTTKASINYNSSSQLYNFEFSIAPESQEFVFLNETEKTNLINQILTGLTSQGFSVSSNTKIMVTTTSNDVFDEQAVELLDALWGLSPTGPDYVSYFRYLGIIIGAQMTAVEACEDLLMPNPPDIVVQLANEIVTSSYSSGIQLFVKMMQGSVPVYVNGQAYTPEFIAGTGQQILITIANLTGSSSLPASINLNLQNIENAVVGGGFDLYVNALHSPPLEFVLSAGTFSAPLTLDKPWGSSVWWDHSYSVGATEVQDPTTPFIKILARNVTLGNLLFNSSASVLSANASMIDSAETANLTVIVPLLLDQSNSSAFDFTLNGNPIPCNSTYLPDYGYYVTVNLNFSGQLIMGIPSIPPSIVASANPNAIYIVSGSGFPANASLWLQYFDGANWVNFTGASVTTSDTGDFYTTASNLTVNSNYVSFKANDSLGDVAYTSIASAPAVYLTTTPSKNVVAEGNSINVTITLRNEGNYTEACNITLYESQYGQSWPICTFTNVALTPNSTVTLTTTLRLGVGSFLLVADASPIGGMTYTSTSQVIGIIAHCGGGGGGADLLQRGAPVMT